MPLPFASAPCGEIPPWLAVILPAGTYLAHFVFGAMGRDFYDRWINGEFGLTELATLASLAVAIVFAVAALRGARALGDRLLAGWMAIFALGAIYFLGEEASWGQHVFGWETPEDWAAVNDQEETNFHNSPGIIGALLDNLPRAVLTAAALLAGFAYPAWRAMSGRHLSPEGRAYWFFPTSACLTVGLIAPLSSVPRSLAEIPPPVFDLAYGEIKELMLALFLMIYAISLALRLRSATISAERLDHRSISKSANSPP